MRRRSSVAPTALLAAVGVTALGYLIMCGYDLLGMRYIRGNIPPGRTAFASFLSMVFSNNVGLSVIGASAVRLRLYTAWGLGVADVLKLVAFTSVSFWLGIFTVAGLAFVVNADPPARGGAAAGRGDPPGGRGDADAGVDVPRACARWCGVA